MLLWLLLLREYYTSNVYGIHCIAGPIWVTKQAMYVLIRLRRPFGVPLIRSEYFMLIGNNVFLNDISEHMSQTD